MCQKKGIKKRGSCEPEKEYADFTTLLPKTKESAKKGQKRSRGIKAFYSVGIREQRAVEANIQANHRVTAFAQKRVNMEVEQKRRSPIIEG